MFSGRFVVELALEIGRFGRRNGFEASRHEHILIFVALSLDFSAGGSMQRLLQSELPLEHGFSLARTRTSNNFLQSPRIDSPFADQTEQEF